MEFTIQGTNGYSVDGDSVEKALHVSPQGITVVTFDPLTFTSDSFGRLRTSGPETVFDSNFQTSALLLWELGGAGTQSVGGVPFALQMQANSWRQSFFCLRYGPGISSLARFSFCFNLRAPNAVMRVGAFTDQGTTPSARGDGIFLEANGQSVSIVRRTLYGGGSGSEDRTLQSDWGLDAMDGKGPSGILLDWAAAQQLVLDYQFLGVGTIRVGFQTTAGLVWVHSFHESNALPGTWARTGNLPLRAEFSSAVAQVITTQLSLFACSVVQEGRVSLFRGNRHRSVLSGASVRGGANGLTSTPIMSLRQNVSNDVTKRSRVVPTRLSLVIATAATGNPMMQWGLLLGRSSAGDAVGPSAATFTLSTDGAQVDIASNTSAVTVTSGTIIAQGFMKGAVNTVMEIDLSPLWDNILLPRQNAAGSLTTSGNNVLMLVFGPADNNPGTAATVSASMSFREIV